MRTDQKPSGVGGWLLLLCVGMTVILPLISVFALLMAVVAVSLGGSLPGDALPILVIETVVDVLGFVAGVLLWRKRPFGVPLACFWLWLRMFVSILGLWLGAGMRGLFDEGWLVLLAGLAWSLAWALFAVVWYFYLQRSRRVRNTYGRLDPIASRLARARGFAEVFTVGKGRILFWVGASYFLALLLGPMVRPIIDMVVEFIRYGEVFSSSEPEFYPKPEFLSILLGMQFVNRFFLALLLAVILGRAWTVLRQLVAWAIGATVCSWALSIGISAIYSDNSLITIIVGRLWPTDFLVLITRPFFFGALLLSVRFWGIRAWSLAVGVTLGYLLGDAVFQVEAVSQGRELYYLWQSLGNTVLSGLVVGVMIYGGVYLQVAHRLHAGASDSD